MPAQQTIEPVLSPELEALAHAADQRLRADLDDSDHEIGVREHAVRHAASAAIAAGVPLSAIAQAEQIGQARARHELGSELLRRVERAARRSREATAEYERSVARAVRLGLGYREIAAAAQIAHGTIRAILARVSDTITQPAANASTDEHHEHHQRGDGEPPTPDATQH
ncbi:MAG: hypothetical protein ACLP01_25370 [Solirubrobacteraceae bacterium]